MSYARFSEDSDVYVFLRDLGLECCSCTFAVLAEMRSANVTMSLNFLAHNTDDMLAHLDQHRAAGHVVPDYAYEGLRDDRRENDIFLGACPPEPVDLDAAWTT